jgi:hypothetical protein
MDFKFSQLRYDQIRDNISKFNEGQVGMLLSGMIEELVNTTDELNKEQKIDIATYLSMYKEQVDLHLSKKIN